MLALRRRAAPDRARSRRGEGRGRGWAAADDLPFFEDGAEPAQLDGYGRIADEIVEQLGGPPAAVVIPVGNGALLAGVGSRLDPARTRRIGVVAEAARVMADSWEAGRPVGPGACATFADGLAVRVAIPFAVGSLARACDRMVRVSERAIAEAVGAFARAGIRAEGAAAAALAALREVEAVDGPVVLIVTGRNIDEPLWRRALDRPESFSA